MKTQNMLMDKNGTGKAAYGGFIVECITSKRIPPPTQLLRFQNTANPILHDSAPNPNSSSRSLEHDCAIFRALGAYTITM